MQRDSMTESLWQQLERPSVPGHVPGPEEYFDVVVVGAGITGLTTALLLQEGGLRCLLLEAHTLGFGTSGGTTAHLNTYIDTPYQQIEKDFGPEQARLCAAGCREAISLVHDLAERHGIDCDFGYAKGYIFSQDEAQNRELEDMSAAMRRCGIQVQDEDKNPLPIPFLKCVSVPSQASFHPMKYLYGLARAFINAGGLISEHNPFRRAKENEDACLIETEKGRIRAGKLVYATHIPPGINLLHFYCAPYRSYALGIRLAEEESYPEGLVYDLHEPYHYYRTHVIGDKPYLVMGGEDHKTGTEPDPEGAFLRLEAYARANFRVDSIDFKWSSQYYVPADGLPYIGRLPGSAKSIFVASGFDGNGMTFGSLSGIILSELILKGDSVYAELFRPGRVKLLAGFQQFLKENTDVVKHFIADRIGLEELESLAELPPGEGRIVEYQGRKLAVSKDLNGKVKALDPVCPHAKCIVQWNSAEKSWDCPCHGSRFDTEGHLLTGPATHGLQLIHIARDEPA